MLLTAIQKQIEKQDKTINFNTLVTLINTYTKRATIGVFKFSRDVYL